MRWQRNIFQMKEKDKMQELSDMEIGASGNKGAKTIIKDVTAENFPDLG